MSRSLGYMPIASFDCITMIIKNILSVQINQKLQSMYLFIQLTGQQYTTTTDIKIDFSFLIEIYAFTRSRQVRYVVSYWKISLIRFRRECFSAYGVVQKLRGQNQVVQNCLFLFTFRVKMSTQYRGGQVVKKGQNYGHVFIERPLCKNKMMIRT